MKIYTGIEIGTNSIKLVILSKVNNRFHLIDKVEVKTEGVKKGKIVNTKVVVHDLSKAKEKLEEDLNLRISKAVVCIPSYDVKFDIVSGMIDISGEVSGSDVTEVIKKAIENKLDKDYELITTSPIGFRLDNKKEYKNPVGKKSTTLESKMVITSIPRRELYPLLDVLELCSISLVDITFKAVGDYSEVRNNKTDSEVGAIVNIGEDITNISIYNKGIMIKSSIINVGSHHVDHDISYAYKLGLKESRRLKEEYISASTRYADKYDEIEIKNEANELTKINQYNITKVVEARVEEILKLSKKEIKNLTNRKISYIIILGGLSEMTGFHYVASNILGNIAEVWNSNTLGVRHNKYASIIGTIKYFDDKLMLRDKEVKMFIDEDIERLTNSKDSNVEETFKKFQSLRRMR